MSSRPEPPLPIIPRPLRLECAPGRFHLTPRTVIEAAPGAAPEARLLAEALAPATGFTLEVRETGTATPGTTPSATAAAPAPPPAGTIRLALDPDARELSPEGYRLHAAPDQVRLTALRPAGLFYACQTLLQLLPPEIFSPSPVPAADWSLPCLTLEDRPRFPWRGYLLDSGRHFFSVHEIKRAIDLLALHKVNRFHWHLTEDQGWRIEIRRYPRLTETGSWRTQKDGSRYGGFYTQDEIRDVVRYAAARHMTVVPEIELPGHSLAALAAYPELGCTGGPYTIPHHWGIYKDVYCAGQEAAFTFLENVLEEVLALFPSPWIHIGGDECPKDRWKACPRCQARLRAEGLKDEYELQSWFIRRFDRWLQERGRRLIGWDEILEGGLAPGAIVQSWRGMEGGIEAASSGHDVIISPVTHCYLDYSHAAISLEKAYSFEPVPPELSADRTAHVLGLEGNMWTERTPDRATLDSNTWPRMTALAEVAWSPADSRDWEDFQSRMAVHEKRFALRGVTLGRPEDLSVGNAVVVGQWTAGQMKEEGAPLEWDVTERIDAPGVYEVLPWYTSGAAAVEIDWIALLENGCEIARDTHEAWSGHDKRNLVYRLELKERTPGARYTIKAWLRPSGHLESYGDVYLRKGE